MRLNQFVAYATGLSRRAADKAIAGGRVNVDGRPATLGQQIAAGQTVKLDGQPLSDAAATATIMLNKPPGYVVSRQGQGSRTVYDLLPPKLQTLKPVGRLDKDSSGLLLLTNDGQLANRLTHPRYAKTKLYRVELDKSLAASGRLQIEQGIRLDDGLSHLQLKQLANDRQWQVTMSEGRNRQIRRTFAAAGYTVIKLHRTGFGSYRLGDLADGRYKVV